MTNNNSQSTRSWWIVDDEFANGISVLAVSRTSDILYDKAYKGAMTYHVVPSTALAAAKAELAIVKAERDKALCTLEQHKLSQNMPIRLDIAARLMAGMISNGEANCNGTRWADNEKVAASDAIQFADALIKAHNATAEGGGSDE